MVVAAVWAMNSLRSRCSTYSACRRPPARPPVAGRGPEVEVLSSWRNEKCFIGDPSKPVDSHFAFVQLGPILQELEGEWWSWSCWSLVMPVGEGGSGRSRCRHDAIMIIIIIVMITIFIIMIGGHLQTSRSSSTTQKRRSHGRAPSATAA